MICEEVRVQNRDTAQLFGMDALIRKPSMLPGQTSLRCFLHSKQILSYPNRWFSWVLRRNRREWFSWVLTRFHIFCDHLLGCLQRGSHETQKGGLFPTRAAPTRHVCCQWLSRCPPSITALEELEGVWTK